MASFSTMAEATVSTTAQARAAIYPASVQFPPPGAQTRKITVTTDFQVVLNWEIQLFHLMDATEKLP